jgi:hypothetical protein
MRWRLLLIAGVLAGAVVSAPAAAQQRMVRFQISAVGDSTLSFRIGEMQWVRPGQVGTAIDPARRDALVARFRIVTVQEGAATALVTGQTTAVSTDHVATLEEPKRPWFRNKGFWSGLFLGAAMAITGTAISR